MKAQEIYTAMKQGRKVSDLTPLEVSQLASDTATSAMQTLTSSDKICGIKQANTFAEMLTRDWAFLTDAEVDIAMREGSLGHLNVPDDRFPSPRIYSAWIRAYAKSDARSSAAAKIAEERKAEGGATREEAISRAEIDARNREMKNNQARRFWDCFVAFGDLPRITEAQGEWGFNRYVPGAMALRITSYAYEGLTAGGEVCTRAEKQSGWDSRMDTLKTFGIRREEKSPDLEKWAAMYGCIRAYFERIKGQGMELKFA